jgi:Glycine-zipper domain
MINSLRVMLITLAGVTLGGWASAQTALPSTSAEPFIYPSKGQTAKQEQKDKSECYGWASQQTGFDPAQELQDQQEAAARARQQSQQAQQTAVQQTESTQGQGVGGAARGAAGGAIVGAIAGNAGKGAAIGSAVGLLAGFHRRRAEEIQAANQQLQTQQQIAAQSAQQLAISQQKLANYNLAFKTCMQGRGYTLN